MEDRAQRFSVVASKGQLASEERSSLFPVRRRSPWIRAWRGLHDRGGTGGSCQSAGNVCQLLGGSLRDRDSTVAVNRWLNTPLRTDDFGGEGGEVLDDRITSGNGSRPRIPQRRWNNCLTRRSNTERSLTTKGLLESLIDGRRRGSGGFQHSLKRFSSRDSTWKWIKFLNVVVSL